jgi:hypothetical protein
MVVQPTAATMRIPAITTDKKLKRFIACFFILGANIQPENDKEIL